MVQPWELLDADSAPDGSRIELLRRGETYLIRAGGHDLMSSEDGASAAALGELGCGHLRPSRAARVLIGGLGMGFTARAALARVGREGVVEVVELVPAVARWNEVEMAGLARHPLRDARCTLRIGDVGAVISLARAAYDAILLDVDNGPDALAHDGNAALYEPPGLARAMDALVPGGVLGVWSFSDDAGFTRRLERAGFEVRRERVSGSRKGRGRYHVVWLARRPSGRTRSR